jgi:probable phosphoglycerate mutase
MRLILVRHGDAYAGFHGIIGGHRGCKGLTPLGRRQAEALRDHLAGTNRVHADVLFASELPRAIETATIIAPALEMETFGREDTLCELHPGESDGLTWTEYAARYGSFDMEAEPERVFAPGGESWTTFHERVRGMLDRLAEEFANDTVVAVCHAGVIVASLRLLLGIPQPGSSIQMRPTNTGITEWEHQPATGLSSTRTSGAWVRQRHERRSRVLRRQRAGRRRPRRARGLGRPIPCQSRERQRTVGGEAVR